MGSHSKKHKKNRHRSRSRSPSSERGRHKSRRWSRSRSISRSSSDSHRSDRRTKSKKHRRRSRSKSRSRSRSRSPLDRYRSRRSRSRSKERDRLTSRHGRKSRSRSVSKSRKRSRSRSRRSRSRSQSPERASHSRSHSRHDSKEKSKIKDIQGDKHLLTMMPAETVKQKMQKALEAAASATDKLKEKGVIPATIKQETLSLAEEREKQQAIAEIEDDSFKPSTFLSGQSLVRVLPATLSKEQNHDNAIFGSAAVTVAGLNQSSFKRNQTIFYKTVNRGELASSLLAKSSEEKMEAWMKKLTKMRQDKIQANPEYFKKLLTIGTVADDSWSVQD